MGAVSGVRLSALWPLPPTAPSAKRKGHAQRAALRCGDSTLKPQPVHMQYAHRACSPPPATHLRVPHPLRALCDGWDGTHSTSHNTLLLFCLSCCHPRRESAFASSMFSPSEIRAGLQLRVETKPVGRKPT